MVNASLFRRTLSCYKSSLSNGDYCTLYRYCKIHNVNYKNMRYWMITQSINLPEVPTCESLSKTSPASHPQKMIPLTILSPEEPKREIFTTGLLREVSISVTENIVVNIKEISTNDLASIILTCQSR